MSDRRGDEPPGAVSPIEKATEPPAPPGYKSRRVGLGCFGSILILGGLFSLFSPLIYLLSHFLRSQLEVEGPGLMGPRWFLYTSLSQLVFAVLLLTLGVGSFLARRWARSLTLVVSFYGLVIGLLASVMMAVMVPRMREQIESIPNTDPAVTLFATVFMVVMMGFTYLVMPGAFILFYRSRHVKAACEHRNPRESWTDRCPLPVLEMSVGLAVIGIFSLLSPIFVQTFPFFGVPLHGMTAIVMMVALSLAWFFLSWGVYKQRLTAWWQALFLTILIAGSAAVTIWRMDMLDELARMGMSETELETIAGTGLLSRPVQLALWVIPFSLWIIYMLAIRKHFSAGRAGPVRATPNGDDAPGSQVAS